MNYLFIAVFLTCFIAVRMDCIWYGCTGDQPPKYKPYAGPPKAVTDPDFINLLRSTCVDDFGDAKLGETKTCCSTEQMAYVATNINLAKPFLRRCQQCARNLARYFCLTTCGPDQNEYMNITGKNSDDTVSSVDLKLYTPLMDGIYHACESIWVPSMGQKAVSVLCGSNDCDPFKLFTYMGSTDNGVISFDIKIIPTNRIRNVLNFDYKMCNLSYPGLLPCGCEDCEDSCGPPWPQPKKPKMRKILTVRLFSFIMICVFLAGLVLLAFVIWMKEGFKPIIDFSKRNVGVPVRDFVRRASLRYSQPENDGGARSDKENRKNLRKVRQRLGKEIRRIPNRKTKTEGNDDPVDPNEERIPKLLRFAQFSAKIDYALISTFRKTTRAMTRRWYIPLIVSCLIALVLSAGITKLRVETDPLHLWSEPTSESRREMDYFNSQFGPFYRVEQLIIRPTNMSTFTTIVDDVKVTFGPVFDKTFLQDALNLQLKVQNISAGNTNLSDICFAPLVNENRVVSKCLILSIFGYLGNDLQQLKTSDYLSTLVRCIGFPIRCLAPYGGPVQPKTILGGYSTQGKNDPAQTYLKATSLIITFLVENYNDEERLQSTLDWEKNYLDFMDNWVDTEQPKTMEVIYSAQRSLKDEVDKETEADILPLLMSYFAMFIYIATGMGRRIGAPKYLVYSRISLGFAGILIVIFSISSSVGFFSYIGVPVTMIVIEVVPFLVLAVGTDNMFLMVQCLSNTPAMEDETDRERVIRVMGMVGPSTLLTTTAEIACFMLGTLSRMPAVRQFCLYAGAALLFAFLLQYSAFVAVVGLDSFRQKAGRLDVLCCVKVGTAPPPSDCLPSRIFSRYILPAMFRPTVRIIIVILFWAVFCFTLSCQPKVSIGLDATDVMHRNSTSAQYLQAVKEMKVGPPVFFVVREGLNYTDEAIQNCICSNYGSNDNSLTQMIHQASRSSSWTYIASPASSWLDDFVDWTTAIHGLEASPCCRYYDNMTYCPTDDESDCKPCSEKTSKLGRPLPEYFGIFLEYFLSAIPDEECPKAGKAAYSKALKTTSDSNGVQVEASYFMTYHTLLTTSMDYISAVGGAREVANRITEMLRNSTGVKDASVFPYSVFYVFYEQYITMGTDVLLQSLYAIIAVLLCFFVGSGFDIFGTIVLLLVLTGVWSGMWGMMWLVNIPLNAISLVNIILVFTGITLTKFIGIACLAFAKSPIYNIFYFRMYLIIVFLGALHGLVLTPVIMSHFGEMGVDKFWNAKRDILREKDEEEQ